MIFIIFFAGFCLGVIIVGLTIAKFHAGKLKPCRKAGEKLIFSHKCESNNHTFSRDSCLKISYYLKESILKLYELSQEYKKKFSKARNASMSAFSLAMAKACGKNRHGVSFEGRKWLFLVHGKNPNVILLMDKAWDKLKNKWEKITNYARSTTILDVLEKKIKKSQFRDACIELFSHGYDSQAKRTMPLVKEQFEAFDAKLMQAANWLPRVQNEQRKSNPMRSGLTRLSDGTRLPGCVLMEPNTMNNKIR